MTPKLRNLQVLGRSGFRSLAYAEWGSPRAEKTIVCLHGVSRNGRDFDVLASALAELGARVIAPDLPGRGRSEWLDSPLHYTDRAYNLAMSALIARLDVERVDWVGTSLGAHVGMMLAAEAGTPVARLVMNDLGARVSVSALHRIGSYLRTNWRFASMEEANEHLREIHAPFGELTNAQWQHLTEHSVVPDDKGRLRFHYDPAIGARFGIPLWSDVLLWHLWERIRCPVLIMRGAQSDLLSDRTVETMLQRGPAARAGKVRAVTIEGCGHAPALMEQAQIQLVADFIFNDLSEADVLAS